MSGFFVVEPLAMAASDGPALANSAAATSLLPTAAKRVVPADALNRLPSGLWVRAGGRISTLATTPGTFKFDVRLGGIIVWDGGTIALNTNAKTNVGWYLDLLLSMRALGAAAAANLLGQGRFQSEAVIGSPLPTVGGNGDVNLPGSAPAVGTGFDSTAANVLDLFGTWSTANAANSIQLHSYLALLI